MAQNKALFIDRDGILNELVHYPEGPCAPRNWEDVKYYPEIEKFKEVKKWGYLTILITNQPDIERGWLTRQFVDEVLDEYRTRLELDAVYMCPYLDPKHPMKKPNPGMILQAAKDHEIDLSQSFFVGDTDKDAGAAKGAGVSMILWGREYNTQVEADHRIESFDALFNILNSVSTVATI